MHVSSHVRSEYLYHRFVRDIERNESLSYVSFYVVSVFLSDLVFSDREIEKGHDRIMVESKGYCKIVCFFFFKFSDIFT